MILGSIKNTERVEQMHPRFKAFFDYVKTHDLLNEELGKIEIDGDNLFVMNVELDGKSVSEAALEAHHEYIDIQLLLEGSDAIGWKPLEDAEEVSQAYDAEKDLIFYADEADEIINLQPGQFLVLYPEDLHAPGIGEGKIRKLIAKVRV